MKRAAKIALWTLGSLVAIFVMLNGAWYLANLKSIRQAAADHKRCDAQLAQLQHDLPVGTARAEALQYLQAHGKNVVQFGGEGDNVSVNLGKIQSTVWFCSFFIEYADISFTSDFEQGSDRGSLAHIATRSIGECL
jgi:hypothetical protein